jgi:hypothetical protein
MSLASGRLNAKFIFAVRSDQIENQGFGIEAVLSSDREEGRSIRNEIVAGAAGHDVTGGAPLLGQESAALDIGGLNLRGCKRKRETTGNPIHLPPPILACTSASAGSGLFTLIRVNSGRAFLASRLMRRAVANRSDVGRMVTEAKRATCDRMTFLPA